MAAATRSQHGGVFSEALDAMKELYKEYLKREDHDTAASVNALLQDLQQSCARKEDTVTGHIKGGLPRSTCRRCTQRGS